MLLSLTSCGSGGGALSKPFDTGAESAETDEKIIGENSSLRLEWDDTTKGAVLYDLKSGLSLGTSPAADGEE